MNALLASKACDITGIVTVACAWHRCYIPNALVNLYLGKQQKNVEFGIVKAVHLTNIHPEQRLLLIYDIVCQYIIHFFFRIGHLLPNGLDVDAAIGLFHVHAHKEDCFFQIC